MSKSAYDIIEICKDYNFKHALNTIGWLHDSEFLALLYEFQNSPDERFSDGLMLSLIFIMNYGIDPRTIIAPQN